MALMSNQYVKQAIITLAVIAVASRVKGMHPMIEKLLTGGMFTPTGNPNNTSTVS